MLFRAADGEGLEPADVRRGNSVQSLQKRLSWILKNPRLGGVPHDRAGLKTAFVALIPRPVPSVVADIERLVALRRRSVAHIFEFIAVEDARASLPVGVNRGLEESFLVKRPAWRRPRGMAAADAEVESVASRRRLLRKARHLPLGGFVPAHERARTAAIDVERVRRAKGEHYVGKVKVVCADADALVTSFQDQHIEPAAVS